MKKKKIASLALTLLMCSVMVLTGCQKKNVDDGSTSEGSTTVDSTTEKSDTTANASAAKPELDCPFTELGWDNTTEEIIEAEGGEYETYDSVYNGTTYTFDKEYDGKIGTIKYMFDDKDELMCVAWTYVGETTDEINELYKTISDSVTEKYGESHLTDEDTNTVNSGGGVWYLDSGDIIISTVDTEQQKALQYAFLHPEVSNTDEAE